MYVFVNTKTNDVLRFSVMYSESEYGDIREHTLCDWGDMVYVMHNLNQAEALVKNYKAGVKVDWFAADYDTPIVEVKLEDYEIKKLSY